jgi:hypothetical protein
MAAPGAHHDGGDDPLEDAVRQAVDMCLAAWRAETDCLNLERVYATTCDNVRAFDEYNERTPTWWRPHYESAARAHVMGPMHVILNFVPSLICSDLAGEPPSRFMTPGIILDERNPLIRHRIREAIEKRMDGWEAYKK